MYQQDGGGHATPAPGVMLNGPATPAPGVMLNGPLRLGMMPGGIMMPNLGGMNQGFPSLSFRENPSGSAPQNVQNQYHQNEPVVANTISPPALLAPQIMGGIFNFDFYAAPQPQQTDNVPTMLPQNLTPMEHTHTPPASTVQTQHSPAAAPLPAYGMSYMGVGVPEFQFSAAPEYPPQAQNDLPAIVDDNMTLLPDMMNMRNYLDERKAANRAEVPVTREATLPNDDLPTSLVSMPMAQNPNFQDQQEQKVPELTEEELGRAADDPNRIPTFVKVRGLPSNQDPRIVSRKNRKKQKRPSWSWCKFTAF